MYIVRFCIKFYNNSKMTIFARIEIKTRTNKFKWESILPILGLYEQVRDISFWIISLYL